MIIKTAHIYYYPIDKNTALVYNSNCHTIKH